MKINVTTNNMWFRGVTKITARRHEQNIQQIETYKSKIKLWNYVLKNRLALMEK